MTLPNIALITLDAFRFDAISKEYTPNLMKIIEQGCYFKNAFSCSSTTIPSMTSLFSSTYPNMLGGFSNLKRRKTIAEVLRSVGYETIGINTNALIEATYGFDKGFKKFYNLKTNFGTFLFRKILKNEFTKRLDSFIDYHIRYMLNEDYLPSVRGEVVVKTVKELLKSCKKPVFLWCHFMDTHIPYKPPSWISDINLKNPLSRLYYSLKQRRYTSLAKETEKDIFWRLYLNCAKYIDYCVGEIFEELKKDDWIVIITSDHGDEFFEHGGVSHSRKLYDELIHVPLIIHGLSGLNKQNDKLVSHVDILPTLIDVLNLQYRKDIFLGRNFIEDERDFIYAEHESIKAIRTERYKLIIDESSSKIELYDLKNDPLERRNIINDERDVVKDLFDRLTEIERRSKNIEAKYDVLKFLEKSKL